jgi:hypothetical protein
MPHLFSGPIASGLAAVVLFAGRTVAVHLVFEGQVRAEGLRGEFFADGSEQNDIRHRAEFRAETGYCFTHA